MWVLIGDDRALLVGEEDERVHGTLRGAVGLADDPVFLGIDNIEDEAERAREAEEIDPVERLRELVNIAEQRNSRVVEIAAEYPDPEIAAEIATKSPPAIRLAKESLNRVDEMPFKEAYRTEQEYTARLGNYEDSKEAMAAFREKRPPRFKGY